MEINDLWFYTGSTLFISFFSKMKLINILFSYFNLVLIKIKILTFNYIIINNCKLKLTVTDPAKLLQSNSFHDHSLWSWKWIIELATDFVRAKHFKLKLIQSLFTTIALLQPMKGYQRAILENIAWISRHLEALVALKQS